MLKCIGIRRETKDKTQRRAPLSPTHVRALVRKHGIRVLVEPWPQRVFPDAEYRRAGAEITDDLSSANIIFGVKEVTSDYLLEHKAYCFFSHTIKGQEYNMDMLQTILDRNISLFDYELVKDNEGKRIVFFGDYAGYAGMIDTLWALGRRLSSEGIRTPFSGIKYANKYESLEEASAAIHKAGRRIARNGLPRELVPFVVGFTGYGRVSTAAQNVFDLLPYEEMEPQDLPAFMQGRKFSNRVLYKVKFQKPDMFQHLVRGKKFNVKEFTRYPYRYVNRFERYVPFLNIIVNGIYWEPQFPSLLSKRYIKTLFAIERRPRLRVIGDITCDVEGSIELTVKTTDSRNPLYVFEARTGKTIDGWRGRGPVVLAVDMLPTELPREASEAFGTGLLPFVPKLAAASYSKNWNTLNIPSEFRDALITHHGHLTPCFTYLKKHLPK